MPATNDAFVQNRLREALAAFELSPDPEPPIVRRLRALGFTTRQIVDILETVAETLPGHSRCS